MFDASLRFALRTRLGKDDSPPFCFLSFGGLIARTSTPKRTFTSGKARTSLRRLFLRWPRLRPCTTDTSVKGRRNRQVSPHLIFFVFEGRRRRQSPKQRVQSNFSPVLREQPHATQSKSLSLGTFVSSRENVGVQLCRMPWTIPRVHAAISPPCSRGEGTHETSTLHRGSFVLSLVGNVMVQFPGLTRNRRWPFHVINCR